MIESAANGRSRLIPAHAGKTTPGRSPSQATKAHPRSRGENVRSATSCVAMSGSSPLTRGKPRHPTTQGLATGLIPAHAGKTCSSRAVAALTAAHPRSRGENSGGAGWRRPVSGSSPLTRGKQGRRGGEGHPARLIPAHAGKTTVLSYRGAKLRAHPRSRGENVRL